MYNKDMTQATVLQNLEETYSEVSGVVSKANRTLLECEAFMSDIEHEMKNNVEVKNVEDYFLNLIKKDEKDTNN